MSYLEQHDSRSTPQSEPIPGSDQAENSAGGYAWAVDPWTRLRRFLILGSEGGSYYASERDLTRENVDVVRQLAVTDGEKLVAEIVAVSDAGRAPSNDPALFALAVALSHGDHATKLAAGKALPAVARIGTHLYHFVRFLETQRGWGRQAKRAVAEWYETKPLDALAYDAVKYRQRDGWSHRDLLRVSHPKARIRRDPLERFGKRIATEELEARRRLFAWIVGGSEKTPLDDETLIVNGFERAQRALAPSVTASLVREYRLPREALNPDHLSDPDVWRALLDVGMPLGALTRNLANMTRLGVLDGDYGRLVADQLGDAEAVRKSRLHPLALLTALRTYASGHGFRGTNTWTPLPRVTDALDAAFYLAFDNVEPTGVSTLLALDVSPSMANGNVAGSPLTPREASVAMALVALHAEPDVEVVAFAGELHPLGLSARQRLDDAVRSVSGIRWSHTNCALPMIYALERQKSFGAFFVYTDSETYFGDVHPAQALVRYRQVRGVPARLGIVGMVANGFSIADPNDAGMLDVVGFDTSTPAVLADFAAGRI